MELKSVLIFLCYLTCRLTFAQSDNLDSLKSSVESIPDDSLKTETYLRIAYILYAGDESELYAQKALELAKKLNSPYLIGKSYHRLAWCHGLDEMDKKTAYLDSAAATFTSIADYYGLGNVFDTKGTILMEYGSLSEANDSYQQAYDYYARIGNEERKAGVLNNWAIAEYSRGNVNEAIQKFRTALAFRVEEKPISQIDIARLYQGLGECYRLQGDLELATRNYLKGYEHRKAAGNIGVVESMLSIASMMYDASEQNIDTTSIQEIIRENGFDNSMSLIEQAENTRGVSDRIGIQESIMDVRRRRFLLNKDFEAAYELLLRQKQIQEEYKLRESSLEAMADLKVKFEKDQLTIQLLKEEVLNQKKQEQVTFLIISLAGLFLISMIGFLYYQNRVKSAQIELKDAHREQQIVSMRSMLEGQEKERSRIARDLHDGLGNLLSTLKVNIGSLQINFDDSNAKKIYGSASQMIDEACTEVRKIAHEMMPQALKKLGLRKAIEDLVKKMDATHPFDAEFHVHGVEQTFDDNTNVMLYRIVQEALNNIVKYAKASEVSVQITYSDEWFDLTIEDDGVGFDPGSIDSEKGMGLKSIAFRTEFIGGTYDINSRPGVGTLVTINLPLHPKTEA
ncbi:sensor histidine kinase [Algoriphagus halophilus]|uniref:tetratricopeptide repeat-containing sensor histidine kinase n=1 Tax=Algoriphagus halophilus TaxID=226505 RepID=UPI00358ED479